MVLSILISKTSALETKPFFFCFSPHYYSSSWKRAGESEIPTDSIFHCLNFCTKSSRNCRGKHPTPWYKTLILQQNCDARVLWVLTTFCRAGLLGSEPMSSAQTWGGDRQRWIIPQMKHFYLKELQNWDVIAGRVGKKDTKKKPDLSKGESPKIGFSRTHLCWICVY